MRESGVQCARCGSSLDFEDCEACGGAGYTEDDDEEGTFDCPVCENKGSWPRCLSTPEFCEANPLPGRGGVERSTEEWFEFEVLP